MKRTDLDNEVASNENAKWHLCTAAFTKIEKKRKEKGREKDRIETLKGSQI